MKNSQLASYLMVKDWVLSFQVRKEKVMGSLHFYLTLHGGSSQCDRQEKK